MKIKGYCLMHWVYIKLKIQSQLAFISQPYYKQPLDLVANTKDNSSYIKKESSERESNKIYLLNNIKDR